MSDDIGLVSIIMPAYNCEKTISESIESVLQQSYSDWELLIVDDGSTDNTSKVIENYLKIDDRIRYYHLSENSGSAAAKNYAISMAKGEYIAFLDSDDLWHKQKVEKQLLFMKKNNYVFSFTAYEFFNNSIDKKRKYISVPLKVNYKKYLSNTIIGNSTVMMNKDAIGEIVIQNGFLEDVLTWMYYLKKGINAYGLNEVLMSYRVYKSSKSGKKIKNSKRYYRCLRDTQHLSVIVSFFYWILYAFNASKKRIFAKKSRTEN